MSCLGNSADRSLQRHWALPPGIRPGDCDGPAPADADADQFWAGCAANLRERIAMQFARARADDVRDALLDAQMPARVPAHAIHQAVGAALWRAWIGYRDQVLEQLQRRGQFDLELPQER
jgi:hypothetical protein